MTKKHRKKKRRDKLLKSARGRRRERASASQVCPISAVDQRLDDVRVTWIEAQKSYNDPHDFRRRLNACITALRSVTFVLQKHKTKVPDFVVWYAKWKENMRDDNVMKWLIGARNYIEKEGDLKTLSVANVKVTIDWGMSIYQTLLVDPFVGTSEIAQTVRESVPMPTEKVDSALLTVERRWVDVQLPDYEVLDALSYCYSFIARVVENVHRQIGTSGPCPYMKARGVIGIDPKRIEHLGRRPPCMVATRSERTIWVKLSTGEELRPVSYHREFDREEVQEAGMRYGLDKSDELFKKKPETLTEEAEYWFNMAKIILCKDGYHIPTIMLYGPNPTIINMRLDEQVDKYLMWERIAEHVEVSGADKLVVVAEAWLRVPEEKLHPTDYSFKPREGLTLIAASKDGGFVSICAEFKRDRDGIYFQKEHASTMESPMDKKCLESVRRVWELVRVTS